MGARTIGEVGIGLARSRSCYSRQGKARNHSHSCQELIGVGVGEPDAVKTQTHLTNPVVKSNAFGMPWRSMR